jgi:hypothetical protein
VDDAVLYQLLYSGQLSPEQQHRIINVLIERTLTARAAAIGIEMSRAFRSGVLVERVVVGMPADGVLEEGDRITHVNGRAVWNSDMLVEELRGFRPGDAVSLRFERPAPPGAPDPAAIELREATITLAPAERLGERHMQEVYAVRMSDARDIMENAPVNAVSLRVPDRFGAVDAHPLIAALRRQIDAIEMLDADARRALIRSWQTTYEELRRWYGEAGISREERQYRRDVLNRFVELLPADLLGDT